ncbi:hypothetical protein BIZ83_gp143 [Erwinia phage vB_EamM_ChrisDB]|uniref:hypothetical protein n=1 Tax=Erwinia phage vB_EamM_ChrisDB TaxID=1883371 RepID=UPI00081CF2BE|nr:hypothetical protein BIZ83_gp143 [Erwinia phage vB_EamM_ChrisDB]ANZ48710.1 hypothetical protein CHRISDB_148 [Erwinia phage vB_EamM_ChrisDB]QVW55811.1 hypothetical protein pEaSNUABM9_00230 [Erwinia phage pEa_SNUABM_9]
MGELVNLYTDLTGKSPQEVLESLQRGERVQDTDANADAILMTLVPLRGEHYQIALLGSEYVVRTPGREYEAFRAPRTIGGVVLVVCGLERAIRECAIYIASGGKGHF